MKDEYAAGTQQLSAFSQTIIEGTQNAFYPLCQQTSKLEFARQRHGKPFAAEKSSTWVPRTKPVLTEWLESRGKK